MAAHFDFFEKSSIYIATYDVLRCKFLKINSSIASRMGVAQHSSIQDYEVRVVVSKDDDIYLTICGIPCRLKILSEIDASLKVVEMFPSHTKKWAQSSDLVRLTDLTSDGVWEWFPEVDFEYMSPRFWAILGYDQKEMGETPTSWRGLLDPSDAERTAIMFSEHVKTKGETPYHARVRYTSKDGGTVYVLCRGCVVDWLPDGRPWRILGTHTDITSIVQKDAVEAQTKFIERMSHEIRSPICTILNECEMLEEEMSKVLSASNKSIPVITKTCQQLISLTDNILSLGDSNNGDVVLENKRVDLNRTVTGCQNRHRLAAKKKGIKMRLSTGELPEVMADRSKVDQILDNLVGNSIKYSDSGTVVIDADYDFHTNALEVRIKDGGMGIPKSSFDKVFVEFYQGDSTMSGAGIGLALTRRLARMMGGVVCVEESAEGRGTTMLFTSCHTACSEVECDVEAEEKGVNILIVDDMKTNRLILQKRLKYLERAGLVINSVVQAEDGKEAHETFVKENCNFQLVLMDCLMPVVDGFQATVMIHDECSKRNIESVPVVAITASVSNDIRKQCENHGMKYVVTKPYTELDLLLSVKSCLPPFG